MGTINTAVKFETSNLTQWFYDAYQTAEREYGRSPYNGSISTTAMGRVIEVNDGDIDENAIFENWSRYYGYFEKWSTNFLDLGVTGYFAMEPKYIGLNEKRAVPRKNGVTSNPAVYRVFTEIPGLKTGLRPAKYASFAEAKKAAERRISDSRHQENIARVNSRGEIIEIKGRYVLIEKKRSIKPPALGKKQVAAEIHAYVALISAAC